MFASTKQSETLQEASAKIYKFAIVLNAKARVIELCLGEDCTVRGEEMAGKLS